MVIFQAVVRLLQLPVELLFVVLLLLPPLEMLPPPLFVLPSVWSPLLFVSLLPLPLCLLMVWVKSASNTEGRVDRPISLVIW